MVTITVSAKLTSKSHHRMPATRKISTMVGRMLNSRKFSAMAMPRVPRSITRESPPVARSMWKRMDSACRWRKTRSATQRAARACTLAKTALRSSARPALITRRSP